MYLFSTDHHWNNNINCVAYLSFLLKLKYCRDPSFHIVLVHSGNVECEPPYSYPGKPTYYMLRVKLYLYIYMHFTGKTNPLLTLSLH